MPLYDYQCQGCPTQFERLVAGPRTRVKCPECGGKCRRLAASRFAIKGESPFAPMLGDPDSNCYPSG